MSCLFLCCLSLTHGHTISFGTSSLAQPTCNSFPALELSRYPAFGQLWDTGAWGEWLGEGLKLSGTLIKWQMLGSKTKQFLSLRPKLKYWIITSQFYYWRKQNLTVLKLTLTESTRKPARLTYISSKQTFFSICLYLQDRRLNLYWVKTSDHELEDKGKYLKTDIFISLKNTYEHAVNSFPRHLLCKT